MNRIEYIQTHCYVKEQEEILSYNIYMHIAENEGCFDLCIFIVCKGQQTPLVEVSNCNYYQNLSINNYLIIYRVLIGIVTYFVAGALIMKFNYQSTGTDVIPNKELWVTFPFLVKVMMQYLH